MSINDLIHTNAHNAYEQGRKTENERVMKLLQSELTAIKQSPLKGQSAQIMGAMVALERVIYAVEGREQ